MGMTKDEALKAALEALKESHPEAYRHTITAIREALAAPANADNGGKTGWPPGLLQDDCKGLSKWLASRPDARRRVREALDEQPAIPFGDGNSGLQWDKTSKAFNDWWDSDIDPTGNPFRQDSAAYWAWAGWKAATEQPAQQQEPVAVVVDAYDTPGLQWLCQHPPKRGDKLYTSPQPAQHSASVLEQNTSNSLETTNQEAQDEPVAWMEMVVGNLVREGVNKHKARELAQHFKRICWRIHEQMGKALAGSDQNQWQECASWLLRHSRTSAPNLLVGKSKSSYWIGQ